MILSFLALVLAAAVALVLLPFMFAYSGWSFVLVATGFLIAACFLMGYVGHAQAFVIEFLRKRRQR